MRKLGIDYGDARVGIAITDPLNITAQGLETIQRNNSARSKQASKSHTSARPTHKKRDWQPKGRHCGYADFSL